MSNKIKGDYNFTTVGADGSTITQAVMTSLRPYTRYFIVIQAFNLRGAGPLTSPVAATTMQDSKYTQSS